LQFPGREDPVKLSDLHELVPLSDDERTRRHWDNVNCGFRWQPDLTRRESEQDGSAK
jgi:hypothetical protein